MYTGLGVLAFILIMLASLPDITLEKMLLSFSLVIAGFIQDTMS